MYAYLKLQWKIVSPEIYADITLARNNYNCHGASENLGLRPREQRNLAQLLMLSINKGSLTAY